MLQPDTLALVVCHPEPVITENQSAWLERYIPEAQIHIVAYPDLDIVQAWDKTVTDYILPAPDTIKRILYIQDDVEPIDGESCNIWEKPDYDILGVKYDVPNRPTCWRSPYSWHNALCLIKREIFTHMQPPYWEFVIHYQNSQPIRTMCNCRFFQRNAWNLGYHKQGHIGFCNHGNLKRWKNQFDTEM